MIKMAIIYDFDKTLSPKDMQEFHLYKELGFNEPKDLWIESNEYSVSYNMDKILAYMFVIANRYEKLSKKFLKDEGKYIKLYRGVENWFSRINSYAKEKGIKIEHYIISSGLKSMIEGTSIAKEFKRIYACEYAFKDNKAFPARVVNYTTKTQFIFRINKGVLDWSNDEELNKSTPDIEKDIPYERMIYIGDGYTDVPCMKIVSQFGGYSIAVYGDKTSKEDIASKLYKDNRASYYAKADYSENSKMDKIIKSLIDHVHSREVLNNFKD